VRRFQVQAFRQALLKFIWIMNTKGPLTIEPLHRSPLLATPLLSGAAPRLSGGFAGFSISSFAQAKGGNLLV
jgi:hypothetical protein